jgi:hypothetical protein
MHFGGQLGAQAPRRKAVHSLAAHALTARGFSVRSLSAGEL